MTSFFQKVYQGSQGDTQKQHYDIQMDTRGAEMEPPCCQTQPEVFQIRFLGSILDALASELKQQKLPRPGPRQRRLRSGRGLEGRAHQAASGSPRGRVETGVRYKYTVSCFLDTDRREAALPPSRPRYQEISSWRDINTNVKNKRVRMEARNKHECP